MSTGGVRDRNRRESVQSFFTEEAGTWESHYQIPETFANHGYRVRSEIATGWLAALRGDGVASRDLLELGCGAGVQARRAAALGWRVTGVDLSLEMLERARQGGHISVLSAAAERLPFRQGAFDAVLALGLIGYTSDPSAVLRQIRSALRPRGRLIISFYSEPPYLLDRVSDAVSWVPDRLYLWLKDLFVGHQAPEPGEPGFYQQHNRPFPAREFFGLLKDAGFRRLDWRAVNYGRPRFMGRRLLPERAEILLSRALARIISLPGLGWLRPHARTHVVLAVPSER